MQDKKIELIYKRRKCNHNGHFKYYKIHFSDKQEESAKNKKKKKRRKEITT